MKFALIGAGMIGALRAQALAKSPKTEMVAVYDVDEAKAKALAPNAKFYAKVEDLFADPEIEAVVISTPPQFHEPLTVAAVKAGKHVLVEKPMAATVDACRRMVEAAKAHDRLLMVGFNQRYFDALKVVRDTVRSGKIGKLVHVKAYAGHEGLVQFKAPWMYDPAIMGGGTLLDNGIHILDLTRYVMGDFTEVYGHALNQTWGLGKAEDNAIALFKNKDGVIGQLSTSWTEWRGYRFHIEAVGTHGLARAYYAPMMTTIITQDKPGGARTTTRNFYVKNIFREKFKGWQSTAIDSLAEELEDFVELAHGRPGSGRAATAFDGLRSIEVANALYQSSETGKAVQLTPAGEAAPTKKGKEKVPA